MDVRPSGFRAFTLQSPALGPGPKRTFVRLSGVMAVKPARVWTKLPRREGAF